MITKINPCKFCGETTHWSYKCRLNPKPNSHFKTKSRATQKWLNTRKRWFESNPQDYYICYYCGKPLTRRQTELDHFQSRSRSPWLRHDLGNLVPCCHKCNTLKGSLSGDEFKAKLRSAA